MNRATSIYTATVDTDDWSLLDTLTATLPVPRAGSGVNRGSVFISFRAVDDSAAIGIASETTGGGPYALHTGHGVHARMIEGRPPAGCFCKTILPTHGACLTCTCPDCGAFGRYGVPIEHSESCR